MAKQAAAVAQMSAAAAFWGQQEATAGFTAGAGNGAHQQGPHQQVQFTAPMPLAPPPRMNSQAGPQAQRRAERGSKARDKKEKGDAANGDGGGGGSNGGSGGAYSVSSGDPAGNDRGTSFREKTPHASSSDGAQGPDVPLRPPHTPPSLHAQQRTVRRGEMAAPLKSYSQLLLPCRFCLAHSSASCAPLPRRGQRRPEGPR